MSKRRTASQNLLVTIWRAVEQDGSIPSVRGVTEAVRKLGYSISTDDARAILASFSVNSRRARGAEAAQETSTNGAPAAQSRRSSGAPYAGAVKEFLVPDTENDVTSSPSVTPSVVAREPNSKRAVCRCDEPGYLPDFDGTEAPDALIEIFARSFGNAKAPAAVAKVSQGYGSTIRAMLADGYSPSAIWAAFAAVHRDGKHAPIRAVGAVWPALKAAQKAAVTAAPSAPVAPIAPQRRMIRGYIAGVRAEVPVGEDPPDFTQQYPERGSCRSASHAKRRLKTWWPEHVWAMLAPEYREVACDWPEFAMLGDELQFARKGRARTLRDLAANDRFTVTQSQLVEMWLAA